MKKKNKCYLHESASQTITMNKERVTYIQLDHFLYDGPLLLRASGFYFLSPIERICHAELTDHSTSDL